MTMSKAPGNQDGRRVFRWISWPALLILAILLGKIGWALVDRKWGPGGVEADGRAEHAESVSNLVEALRHDREAKDRAIAEGRVTRVRVATSDGSPFRALHVFVPAHPGSTTNPLGGSGGLIGSPAVVEIDLPEPEIEVVATASECRPGRVRTGRLAPGGAPPLLVLQAAPRIRGRVVGEDGRPVARSAMRLVVEGAKDDLPYGDGGSPPPQLAALFRDRWGLEHLVDAFVGPTSSVAWTASSWVTDEAGRFDAFSPVVPTVAFVLLQSEEGKWTMASERSAVSGDGTTDLGDIRMPRPGGARGFTLLYEDGSPVASCLVAAQPARFPAQLGAAWMECMTDPGGSIADSPLEAGEAYRFVVSGLPRGVGGGIRWGGDQGVGVPSPGAVLSLSRKRPTSIQWTGWEDGPVTPRGAK